MSCQTEFDHPHCWVINDQPLMFRPRLEAHRCAAVSKPSPLHCEGSGVSGIFRKNFHASSTISLVRGRIVYTRLNGLGVLCVSLSVALFNSCRFTVLRGVSSFFAATPIRKHHSVGSLAELGRRYQDAHPG